MAWDNWERLLRLERLSVEVAQRQKENRDALIGMRDQQQEAWKEGDDIEDHGPCGASILVVPRGCNSAVGPPVSGPLATGTTATATIFTTTVSGTLGSYGSGLGLLLQPFPGGTGTLTVSHPRFTDSYSIPVTTSCASRTTVPILFTTPAPGYQCVPGMCGQPMGDTYIHMQDTHGNPINELFTWNAASNQWEGTGIGLGMPTIAVSMTNGRWSLVYPGITAASFGFPTTLCDDPFSQSTTGGTGPITWDETP